MAAVWGGWPDWTVGSAGVHRHEIVGDDWQVLSVRLSHPARPYRIDVGSGPQTTTRIQVAAEVYLHAVFGTLGFSPASYALADIPRLSASPDADAPCFGWLPLAEVGPDRRLTLIAGNRWLDGEEFRPLGGGVALSLELVLFEQDSRLMADIVGSASSLPGHACAAPVVKPDTNTDGGLTVVQRVAGISGSIAQSLALTDPPQITGLRLSSGGDWLAVTGLGTSASGLPLQFEADLLIGDGGVLTPQIRSRAVLVTHGGPIFDRSPPGHMRVKPSERRGQLDGLRKSSARMPAAGGDLVGPPTAAGPGRWAVRPSAVAHRRPVHTLPAATMPSSPTPLRSDALSSVHAWLRADELFRRIDAYKLAAPPLRMVQLPLELHPRAPLRGAPDGDVVNAEVRVRQPPGSSMPALLPAPVEVRFGAAAPAQREWHPAPSGRPGAQALGLAADLRWAWHEFGHVLVFAATGRLELRFAHGIGDALAALIGAPDSSLAMDPDRAGLTFPWVQLGRRHDRSVANGWCWCGRRSALRHSLFGNLAQRAGYFEEQLFSSAMYRAYLSLGGADSGPANLAQRQSASDYLVYLLMRAVLGLPHDELLPARTVEVLVDAMVAIDLGAKTWTCTADWPEGPTRSLTRLGGRVHKVLRWAFEQQGLHAGLAAGQVYDGPALPAVDLYIDDLAQRGGGYDPLPLAWSTAPAAPWMAGQGGIEHNNGTLVVQVRNRGREVACKARVRAWWAPDASGQPVDEWAPLASVPDPTPTLQVAPGALSPVHFQLPPAANPVWVFAAVGNPADPANIDDNLITGPGTPPMSVGELAELVALDNNCALRLL